MLSYAEMVSLGQEVNRELSAFIFVEMLELSPGKFLIFFKKGNERQQLLFSIKHPFERFHLALSEKGKETPFTREITKLLQNAEVIKAELLQEDRIFALHFERDKLHFMLLLELIPRHANLYLLSENQKILTSLRKSQLTEYKIPERAFAHDSTPIACSSENVSVTYVQKEQAARKDELLEVARAALHKQIKKQEKHITQLQAQKIEAEAWAEKEHEAKLLQSNYFQLKKGMKEITLEDWETGEMRTIKLDPNLEVSMQLKRQFTRARKLKASLPYLERFIDKAKDQLMRLQAQLNSLETDQIFPQSEEKLIAKVKPEKKSHPFREYISQKGLIIYVAKNARQNEELTFSFARGLDYWLHVADFAGSHVVLRTLKREEPDQESILDAALLALHFSKAKDEKVADVTFTQVKFLTRGKKMGEVSVSKHKKITVRNDPKRLAMLKEAVTL